MVPAPSDRIVAALRELDPGARALLDLSIRHRFGDEELAKVMAVTPEVIVERRREALDRLTATGPLAGAHDRDEVESSLGALSARDWSAASAAPGTPAPGPAAAGTDEATTAEPPPAAAFAPDTELAETAGEVRDRTGETAAPGPASDLASGMPGDERGTAPAVDEDRELIDAEERDELGPELEPDVGELTGADPRAEEHGDAWEEAGVEPVASGVRTGESRAEDGC